MDSCCLYMSLSLILHLSFCKVNHTFKQFRTMKFSPLASVLCKGVPLVKTKYDKLSDLGYNWVAPRPDFESSFKKHNVLKGGGGGPKNVTNGKNSFNKTYQLYGEDWRSILRTPIFTWFGTDMAKKGLFFGAKTTVFGHKRPQTRGQREFSIPGILARSLDHEKWFSKVSNHENNNMSSNYVSSRITRTSNDNLHLVSPG